MYSLADKVVLTTLKQTPLLPIYDSFCNVGDLDIMLLFLIEEDSIEWDDVTTTLKTK